MIAGDGLLKAEQVITTLAATAQPSITSATAVSHAPVGIVERVPAFIFATFSGGEPVALFKFQPSRFAKRSRLWPCRTLKRP
jgi:hypothetical protein